MQQVRIGSAFFNSEGRGHEASGGPAILRCMDVSEVRGTLDALVDGWCERRSLRPLRYVLAVWPGPLDLTDHWADLRAELRNVMAFARVDLTEVEVDTVAELIAAVDEVVFRS